MLLEMLNWISKSIGLPLEENLHADEVEESPSARDPGGGTLSEIAITYSKVEDECSGFALPDTERTALMLKIM